MSVSKPIKKRSKALRRVKTILKWTILVVVVAIIGLFALKARIKKQAADTSNQTVYKQSVVQRGQIEETVFGTGTTSARNQPNVLAKAEGTLTDLRVAVGDEVKQGDILAVLSNEEIDDTITDLEFELWNLDAKITDTRAGSKVTSIEAPAAGRVVAIYAKDGDDALAVFRREGALAIISTDERMKVELTSNQAALGLKLDETVIVAGDSIYAEGKVVALTRQGTQATITIMEDKLPMDKDLDGDGQVDMIMGRTVEIRNQEGHVIGKGTLEPNKPMAVSAFGGTISRVDVTLGQKVSRTDRMFRLGDSPLTLTIEDLRLQREAAAKKLKDANQERENLIITAPCDGTIAELKVAEGDEISNGTLIGSVLQGEAMNLTIAVDELDVVNVTAGQHVEITVDALGSMKLEGEVQKIAPVGESSGGVTTYDVELSFEAEGTGVRSGMNATGEICVASEDNALYVPVEALMTINDESYVMVADGLGAMNMSQIGNMNSTSGKSANRTTGNNGNRGNRQEMGNAMPGGDRLDMGMMAGGDSRGESRSDASSEVMPTMDAMPMEVETKKSLLDRLHDWLYEGAQDAQAQQMTGTLVKVKVGMQNDDYVQILEGVSEGDVVMYTMSSSSETTFRMGGMGGPMGF